MSEYQLFFYVTYADTDDGTLSPRNLSSQNPVEADPGPLHVGDPGPRILNGEISTFAGVTPNGLLFTFSTYGNDYTAILTLNTVPAYGDTITNFSQIPVFEVPYNFDSMFCFLAGTGIATPAGEVRVETLEIGDAVCTADGRAVPVKWVGAQRVANSSLTEAAASPVVVTANALGKGAPHKDLYLTADHGLILDGLVINAGALVNNATIRYVPMAELPPIFTYYHVETEDHDIILANGVPAETFIDYAGRQKFQNYQQYLDLYGAEALIPQMERPRISSARMLPSSVTSRLSRGIDWEASLEDPRMTVTLSRGAA